MPSAVISASARFTHSTSGLPSSKRIPRYSPAFGNWPTRAPFGVLIVASKYAVGRSRTRPSTVPFRSAVFASLVESNTLGSCVGWITVLMNVRLVVPICAPKRESLISSIVVACSIGEPFNTIRACVRS